MCSSDLRSDREIRRAWALLRRRSSAEADEYDHDALFVALEVIFALDTAGLLAGCAVPDAGAIGRACSKWLTRWDDYVDGLHPKPGFKAERRAVIEASFARFATICDRLRG